MLPHEFYIPWQKTSLAQVHNSNIYKTSCLSSCIVVNVPEHCAVQENDATVPFHICLLHDKGFHYASKTIALTV